MKLTRAGKVLGLETKPDSWTAVSLRRGAGSDAHHSLCLTCFNQQYRFLAKFSRIAFLSL